jgi:hypothetical protein
MNYLLGFGRFVVCFTLVSGVDLLFLFEPLMGFALGATCEVFLGESFCNLQRTSTHKRTDGLGSLGLVDFTLFLLLR